MAKPPKIKTLEIGQGLMWGDVHMRFINRSEVEIRVGRKVFGVMNFNGLGFYDERNPKKPDRIWNILVVLAKLGGEIHSKETSSIDRAGLKKGISQLRQRLKDLFGLKEDPFFPFYRNHSYKAKFNISLSGEDD